MASLLLAFIYICFISLGLPDSLLGAAWPSIYVQFNLPISCMAYISMTISLMTIISSLLSDFLVRKLGAGWIILISVALSVGGLLGFSFVNQYWMFFLFAIPYGLGAGGVDACLNNYVALHYKAKHMSWLHCMWGIGAFISPNIMAYGLTHRGWNQGYFICFVIQAVICLFILISLPLWKKVEQAENKNANEEIEEKDESKPLGVIGVLKLKGSLLVFIAFFCYCTIESSCFSWSATYLVIKNQISEDLAANLVSFFYLGMALGRLINGFMTMKFKNITLIRIGISIIFVGVMIQVFQNNYILAVIALLICGLGCGPIYPSIVQSTPTLFGKKNSQAMIGVQMAFAYLAFLTMPPLFGLLADNLGIQNIYPYFILLFLILLAIMYEIAFRVRTKYNNKK